MGGNLNGIPVRIPGVRHITNTETEAFPIRRLIGELKMILCTGFTTPPPLTPRINLK